MAAPPYLNQERDLDVLSVKDQTCESELFRVTFSFYSAMAKNFILPKDQAMWTEFQDLSPSDTQELISVATKFCDVFSLQNITLSVHLGKWRLREDCFHAHLCFGPEGKERYLQIFEEIRMLPPMNQFWPRKADRFVTNLWRIRRDDSDLNDLHAENVRNNPTWDYKLEDRRNIKEQFDQFLLSTFEEQTLIYHPHKPQIGLPVSEGFRPNDPHHLAMYMRQLGRLGDLLMSRVAVTGCDGCHVCVSVTGEEFAEFRQSRSHERVFGYIRVSGPVFYNVHPHDGKKEWLRLYEREWDGLVYT